MMMILLSTSNSAYHHQVILILSLIVSKAPKPIPFKHTSNRADASEWK